MLVPASSGSLWTGSVGPWMGSLGLSMGFLIFFIFYFMYCGGHLNYLSKSSIYYDLSTEVIVKTTSVNAFC